MFSLDAQYRVCYNTSMKNKNNPLAGEIGLSVKEAVETGFKVSLPNLLDDYTLMKEQQISGWESDCDILWYLASEVSTEHDITLSEADDIVRHSLTSLGVEL